MSTREVRRFEITGMHCGGCVRSVERALATLPGVEHVDVSLGEGAATVAFDAATLAPPAIIAAIEDAGYDARAA